MKIRPIILCGGEGTRLWKKTINNEPKQFINFGGWTLIEKTLKRIKLSTDNMARLNLIGYSRHYYHTLQEVYKLVAGYVEVQVRSLVINDSLLVMLNARASLAQAITNRVMQDMEGGVFDDWQVGHHLLFVNGFFLIHSYLLPLHFYQF